MSKAIFTMAAGALALATIGFSSLAEARPNGGHGVRMSGMRMGGIHHGGGHHFGGNRFANFQQQRHHHTFNHWRPQYNHHHHWRPHNHYRPWAYPIYRPAVVRTTYNPTPAYSGGNTCWKWQWDGMKYAWQNTCPAQSYTPPSYTAPSYTQASYGGYRPHYPSWPQKHHGGHGHWGHGHNGHGNYGRR